MEQTCRERVLAVIAELKEGVCVPALPVREHHRTIARLEPVTWRDAQSDESVALLARWREAANAFFPSQFPVTVAGTQRWLMEQLLELPERILFWVRGNDGTRLGHLGLFRFDFRRPSVEIDNVVRGVEHTLPGLMTASVEALLSWSAETLGMAEIYLRVLSDNARAMRLYERCGFREALRVPLVRQEEGPVVRWVEVDGNHRGPVERYFVTMRMLPAERRAAHTYGQAA
jgi:RimJ/RimL family protein N-acetyltransferase